MRAVVLAQRIGKGKPTSKPTGTAGKKTVAMQKLSYDRVLGEWWSAGLED